MFDVPLLGSGYDDWHCPNGCFCTERTVALPPNSSRYHVCPKLHGLNAPLVREDADCKVVAVERETYLGREIQTMGDDGKAYMAINTERADGSNDRIVHAGLAKARITRG